MKNLDFKYISAKNFLCFGPDGIEFNFNKYNNIVLIRGDNLDVKDIEGQEDKIASNGIGKSSIPEIIIYTLFGKTIKNPKKISHKNIINNQIGKNLKTEVVIGDYKIVRTRKPDSLIIWEDKNNKWEKETEITLGGIPATQKLIEERIGLNYETFVNILVFTDNNTGSFLECDASNKRQIVENLLSLEKYREIAEETKELRKEKKDEIKNLNFEYSTLLSQEEIIKNRLIVSKNKENEWKESKKEEIEDIQKSIEKTKKYIDSLVENNDDFDYLNAQKLIEENKNLIDDFEKQKIETDKIKEELSSKHNTKNKEINSLEIEIDNNNNSINKIDNQIKDCEKEILKFEDNKGSKCKFCLGEILEENYKVYVQKIESKIKELKLEKEQEKENNKIILEKKEECLLVLEKLKKGIKLCQSKFEKLTNEINKIRSVIKKLSLIEKPKDISEKVVLDEKIKNLKEQLKYKNKELKESPFSSIIETLENDIDENDISLKNKKEQLEKLEKEIPYYDFWVVAFGDYGIRKFIIDGIIPALNSRIAYWLDCLIDGKIILEFNNELEEKIQRNPPDGDPFVYHAMSGGERRRLNLAVSQAFAYVMSLSSGVYPSIVFLDEVSTNIDVVGVIGVYNMILELSKDRQVFVTTHDQNLLDLLQGCDLINLEKKNGFTKIR